LKSSTVEKRFAEKPACWPASIDYDATLGCLDLSCRSEVTRDPVAVDFDENDDIGILRAKSKRVAKKVWK
jgi:hypothetical protein